MDNYPFEISDANGAVPEHSSFKHKEVICVGPKNFYLQKSMKESLEKLYNFKVCRDDVWLFGYPRCGTTLAQEIVWLIANDLNFEKASADVIDVRFPCFEHASLFKDQFEEIQNRVNTLDPETRKTAKKWAKPAWELLEETSGRRFIKTHIPLSLAPPKLISRCKIVYLARNPKDACVSVYLFLKSLKMIHEDFEEFWNLFCLGLPYPYFENVKEGWGLKDQENFLFLFYEDYTKDLRKSLNVIAKFLGKTLTEDQLNKLEEHLKIENFRKNKSVNNEHLKSLGLMENENDNFIRKGVTGGWRDYFKGSFNAKADRHIAEQFKNVDIVFPPH